MTPKKLHRFLISNIPTSDTFVLDDSHIVHQLSSVLKLAVGESFILFTKGSADITVTIIDRSKQTLTVTKVGESPVPALPRSIIAAVGIIKGAGFELIVQKLTEIGVTAIVPLLSDRTVKQSIRLDRLQKISNEALEQSGGNTLVTIHEPMTLAESFTAFPYTKIICDAYTTETITTLPDTVVLYIGPEGGWSDNDNAQFNTQDMLTLSLGSKILRTETAAIIGAHTLLWNF